MRSCAFERQIHEHAREQRWLLGAAAAFAAGSFGRCLSFLKTLSVARCEPR